MFPTLRPQALWDAIKTVKLGKKPLVDMKYASKDRIRNILNLSNSSDG